MEEVTNMNDANYCVILSESFGEKRVVKKIFFNVDNPGYIPDMVAWVANYYGYLLGENIRLEVFHVRNGLVYARRQEIA